jgi:(2Fe-2S) ferredoxin
MQMDGELTPEEVKTIIKNVLKAGEKVYKKQKEALMKKYEE